MFSSRFRLTLRMLRILQPVSRSEKVTTLKYRALGTAGVYFLELPRDTHVESDLLQRANLSPCHDQITACPAFAHPTQAKIRLEA